MCAYIHTCVYMCKYIDAHSNQAKGQGQSTEENGVCAIYKIALSKCTIEHLLGRQ